jgi:hypothetical protein
VQPDLFITIAFGAEAALVGIAGGLLVRHEWRHEAAEADADRRELARVANRARAGRAKPPV